jgi:carboxyl-terminal processing protease
VIRRFFIISIFSKKGFLVLVFITLVPSVGAVVTGGWINGNVSAAPDRYEKLKVFTEVLSVVENSYVEEVESEELIYDAMEGMLKSLDPHSGFLRPESYKEMQVETKGEFGGLGIQIAIRDDVLTVIAPIEDTPAWRAGIQAGDQIVKIEDEPTKDMSLHDAVKLMRGPKDTQITISIMREGIDKPKPYTITRAIIRIKSVKYRVLENTSIGYVKISAFQERTARDLARALRQLRKEDITALILDLRNNPGGLLNSAVDVSGQFLDNESMVVYIQGRSGDRKEYHARGRVFSTDMPMVILVNQGSASASEIVSGALKDWNRALVLGVQTFGKGSVQSVIPLSDGSGLRLTTAKYYTPKGTSIQNTGITPDLEVRLQETEGAKALTVLREKDLEGRLDNDQTEKDDKDIKDEEKAVLLHTIKEEDDTQLNRAIEILKNWNSDKGILSGASYKAEVNAEADN